MKRNRQFLNSARVSAALTSAQSNFPHALFCSSIVFAVIVISRIRPDDDNDDDDDDDVNDES